MKKKAPTTIQRNPDGGWLPMPVPSDEKLSRLGKPEREEYRERRQHAEDSKYTRRWRRPTPETADAVWTLLADELPPRHPDVLAPPPHSTRRNSPASKSGM